jgi:hypothetical protein
LKRKYNTHDNATEYKLAVLSILLNNSLLHVTAKGNNLTSYTTSDITTIHQCPKQQDKKKSLNITMPHPLISINMYKGNKYIQRHKVRFTFRVKNIYIYIYI